MDKARKIVALIMGVSLSLLAIGGCGKTSVNGYLKPGLTISRIESIAVFPLDNASGHPDAGKKVSNLLITELVRTGLFEIADVGEVENSLRSLRIRTTAEMDLEKLQKIGERLKVKAVIVGSVDEYELRQDKSGTVPVVAISTRMLDVQTGEILWTISHTRDGDDWETVFGFGKIISLNELAQIVVSETTESLFQGKSTAAHLTANITASPVQVSEGQDIKVVMTVTNTGQANADDVVPSALIGVVNGILSPPGPARLNIPGGGTQDFTWVYISARGDAGDVMFSGNASGKDHSSGKNVSSTPVDSNVVTVQIPASLTATIAVSPAQISEGQDIKVVMTVANSGQAAADVTPSILTGTVNGILSSADPVNAVIPGGGSQNFTWTYISAEGDARNLVFSGNASGKDHNSGNRISFITVNSNVVRVQTPANLTASITASPAQVSERQDVTVVMTVANSGQATADIVMPSALTPAGIQTLSLSSSPPPVAVNIPGGGSQNFMWIYASDGGDAGSVMFSGNASGRDHNSRDGMLFDPVDSNVVRIQTQASLTANITAAPTQVGEGQDIIVVMAVTNSGQASADDVMPSSLTLTGIQTLRLSSSPKTSNVTIPGGGNQDFTWVYTSAEGNAGSVFFSGNAYGKDRNSGNRVSFASIDSNAVKIQAPASLTATINVSPDQVSEGQNITVVMTVDNTGQAGADDVTPSALTLAGTQTLRLFSGPLPVKAAMPAGGSQDFTWRYASVPGDAGDVTFSGNASGKDQTSGESVSFTTVESNVVRVQTPANLTATIAASPVQVSEGQDIKVVMTVDNAGQATAADVIPSILPSSTSGILSSANPISANIPDGGSQDFMWVYTSGKTMDGNVVFLGSVSGRDYNSRNIVSVDSIDSNFVSIQMPTNLVAIITASPAQVSVGQDIAVVMTVTNSGQSTADDVIPAALTLTGVQTLKLTSVPTPVDVSIPVGGSRDFTWIYTSVGGDAGSVIFSGSASGKDQNSGEKASSTPVESNVVNIQIPANLTGAIALSPAQVSEGQDIALTMRVTNMGQATADNVIPGMLPSSGNGLLSSPIPVSATISGGRSQDFIWTYVSAEGDAGDVMFSGNVSGKDHNSGRIVSFAHTRSDFVSVQTPASLTAAITASPAQISEGQNITIVMTVTNAGQADVDFVSPLTLVGPVNGALSSPTPSRAIIMGGGSQDFTWIYTSAEGDAGDLIFSGSVSGRERNSGQSVSSVTVDSDIVSIHIPANLTIVITASPAQATEGQDITVVMKVANSGQADADAVMPSALNFTGVQTLRLLSGPKSTNVTISGNESRDFTWIYTSTAGDAGDVVFSGSASGKDVNSENDVSSASVSSNTITIRR